MQIDKKNEAYKIIYENQSSLQPQIKLKEYLTESAPIEEAIYHTIRIYVDFIEPYTEELLSLLSGYLVGKGLDKLGAKIRGYKKEITSFTKEELEEFIKERIENAIKIERERKKQLKEYEEKEKQRTKNA